MTTAAQAKPETATEATNVQTFKEKYNDVIGASNVGPAPRNVAESLLNIMFTQRVPTSFAKLNKEIAEAAARNDVDAILKLSHDLKNVKDNESQNKKALQELHSKFKFHDVVQAFQAEFEELAYQLAHTALVETHSQLTKAAKGTRGGSKASGATGGESTGTRGPNKSYVWEITKPDGSKVHFPIVMGKTGNIDYKKAEAGYKALGYEVKKEEGSSEYFVEPGTIKLTSGEEVIVTRTNLIDAIQKQTGADYQGWKAEKVEAN